MEIKIYKATEKDETEVLSIFNLARNRMTYLPSLHSPEETSHFILNLIKQGNLYVGRLADKIVGFIDVNEGWVHHLYVNPIFQNKGVGKSLMDFAKQLSPTGLTLWVFEKNKGAITFYEREGFSLALKRNTAEADNEEGLPDRKYVWQPS